MCGINGIVWAASDGQAVPPDISAGLQAMNDALAHRGPDDEGSFIVPGIALGFRRLAIVDLSAAGHQPMHSADGNLTLVFNGEIYNHLELAGELRARGHAFRSRCDAEVVLHGYAEWGPECLHRFNGMWAFAIWDARRRVLFAARDRLGVKPFVYTQQGGRLIFSSEFAGLRAFEPGKRVNAGKLHDYLAYGYRSSDGQTLLDGVRELQPGHRLRWCDGQLSLERWWSLPDERCALAPPARAQHLREILDDAVRLRLRSDVPVALLQSGGIDSSAIASLVDARLARDGGAPVTAFTAVHPGHAEDESDDVAALMHGCPRLRSVLLEPAPGELAEQLVPYVAAMQEPLASASSYAHWRLMQAVKSRGIKVMLNGQGADEALAGYTRYLTGYRLLDLLLSHPGQVPAEMAAIRAKIGQGGAAQMAQLAKAMLGRRSASRWRAHVSEGGARVLGAGFRRAHAARLPDLAMSRSPDNLRRHLRSQLLHHGLQQILHYEDMSSMSQSIEMRSPFVDHRLIAFAASLPDDDLFARGLGKRVLREAFAERLPARIVDNPRKIGFTQPLAHWWRGEPMRRFVARLVASETFNARRLWDARRLAARLTDSEAPARGFPVWRFICTELWLRQMGIEDV